MSEALDDLDENDRARIAKSFERHESVERFEGILPPRTTYIRRPESSAKGAIKNGQSLNDDISAYWNPKSATTRFDQKDRDWVFRFSTPPRDFFSLSWALEAEEIEYLDESILLSFCVDDVFTQNGRPFRGEILSRFSYVKGTNEKVYENKTTCYDGRRVGGFSLHEPSLQASLAYRIWIDLIVTKPTSKTLVFRDPILLMQKRLTLI